VTEHSKTFIFINFRQKTPS